MGMQKGGKWGEKKGKDETNENGQEEEEKEMKNQR